MKLTKILSLIVVLAILASCSKDDEPSGLEKAKLSLSANAEVVKVPTAMASNQDEHAQLANSWVEMANGMSASLALFTPPSGAKKTTEAITPINGRTQGSGSVLVYTWSDAQSGYSVAYQVTDASTKYTFELFYKQAGDAGWYRYLYGEEMKDKSAGYMVLIDAWGIMSDARDQIMYRWDWSRSGDIFTFTMKDLDWGFSFSMEVNTKTNAGSVTYFEGTTKLYEMTWDAQGNGTWKDYDETGAVIDEGTW